MIAEKGTAKAKIKTIMTPVKKRLRLIIFERRILVKFYKEIYSINVDNYIRNAAIYQENSGIKLFFFSNSLLISRNTPAGACRQGIP